MISAVRYPRILIVFFFNDTATTEIYTLSLHDALPISTNLAEKVFMAPAFRGWDSMDKTAMTSGHPRPSSQTMAIARLIHRLEEHTSELQSRQYLVCRLLLEKTKQLAPTPSRSYVPKPS